MFFRVATAVVIVIAIVNVIAAAAVGNDAENVCVVAGCLLLVC